MESTTSLPLPEYTRRSVRAWWADGLWDLAMAGFFAVTAAWLHPLVWVSFFPSWTWPWPFATLEPVNPRQTEFMLWGLGTLGVWIVYTWAAYQLVNHLKQRLIAPRLGEVRFKFFLPVERKILVVYLGCYLVSVPLLIQLYQSVKGGLHLFSAIAALAPGLLFAIGWVYRLPRYQWAALAGCGISLLLELALTTSANYQRGPVNFLDVSPRYGSFTLPFLVWAGVLTISGLSALYQTLRLPYAPKA